MVYNVSYVSLYNDHLNYLLDILYCDYCKILTYNLNDKILLELYYQLFNLFIYKSLFNIFLLHIYIKMGNSNKQYYNDFYTSLDNIQLEHIRSNYKII